jgi:hypothetical protein
MKLFILGLAITVSGSALASSHCYDKAVFAVSDFKEDIEACNAGVDLKNFDKLNRKLIKSIFFYKKTVNKAQAILFSSLNDIDTEKLSIYEIECLNAAIIKHEEKVRSTVQKAIEVCSR